MTRQLLTYPNERLLETSDDVEKFDSALADLLDGMAQTMYSHGGVGLAAPQLGVLERVIIVDISLPEEKRSLIELVNPKISDPRGSTAYDEGCLSLPDVVVSVQRAKEIEVEYFDRHGNKKQISAKDLLSVAIQHEVDHLQGKLLLDYLGPLQKFAVKRKLKKAVLF